MNITQINQSIIFGNNTLEKPDKKKQNFKNILNKDIFEYLSKNENISKNKNTISSQNNNTTEEFLRWAQQTDFISQIQDITEGYKNFIGEGFEGKVYQIPNETRWVLKENNNMFVNTDKTDKEIIPVDDFLPLINVGQAVAIIKIGHGSALSTYKILKTQKGEEYGVPPKPIMKDIDLGAEYTKSRYIKSLTKMAALPQESYENLIDDIEYINRHGYRLDYFNPNNFLIDGDKIKIVDVEEITDKDYKNELGNILYSLLIGNYFQYFNENRKNEEEIIMVKKLNSQISKKFMDAMKSQNKKFCLENVHFQIFLKSDLSSDFFETDNYSEKISKLKKENLC